LGIRVTSRKRCATFKIKKSGTKFVTGVMGKNPVCSRNQKSRGASTPGAEKKFGETKDERGELFNGGQSQRGTKVLGVKNRKKLRAPQELGRTGRSQLDDRDEDSKKRYNYGKKKAL